VHAYIYVCAAENLGTQTRTCNAVSFAVSHGVVSNGRNSPRHHVHADGLIAVDVVVLKNAQALLNHRDAARVRVVDLVVAYLCMHNTVRWEETEIVNQMNVYQSHECKWWISLKRAYTCTTQ
jgi:hypothetical protein